MTTTTTNTERLAKGDEVVVAIGGYPQYAGVWTIDKVNPKTFRVLQNGRSLVGDHELFRPATDADRARVETVDLPRYFAPGTVVEADTTPKMRGRLWVVIRSAPTGRTSVARLGGDQGRYATIDGSMLTEVPLDQVAARLAR